MKKTLSMILRIMLIIAFAITSVTVMSSCSKKAVETKETKETSTVTATTAEVVKPPVHLKILVKETGVKWNSYPDNLIAKEIQKQTGVSFEFVESDEEKYKILIAGGDLPDLIQTNNTYMNDLINGKLIISMEDLLKTNGQDILNNIPFVLDFSRKNWSAGQNKVYAVSEEITSAPHDYYKAGIGLTLRWDYYKEVGAPAINNVDDLIKVISDMAAKHPKTADGKKIYGLSMWNDWGIWNYYMQTFSFTGQAFRGIGGFATTKNYSNVLTNFLTDENSNLWKAVELFYKARKAGLLDPDSFTMKYDDFTAKATEGRILCGPSEWAMGSFNGTNAKDGKGYMVVPVGEYTWTGEVMPLGWEKLYAITSNCKNPDRAMDLLNYMLSYDGARTMWSGVEGVHWDKVDGKPKLKDSTIALSSAGGEEWQKTGIQLEQNFIGFSGGTINPEDGLPLSLFETPEVRKTLLNPLEKDFCDFYNITYPGEIFTKKIYDGSLKGLADIRKDATGMAADALIPSNVVTMPDDIKKIEATLTDLVTRHFTKVILSKSDDEYKANIAKAMEDFKAAGIDQYQAWCTQAWADSIAKVGAK